MFKRRPVAIKVLTVMATAAAVLAVEASGAQANPEYPIPADAQPAPPPIPALPPAGETPPAADAIADPISPDAMCGDWHLQSDYGGFWPAASTWWEYECTVIEVAYPYCPGTGQCSQGYWTFPAEIDHFYWDGSQAVFYGQYSPTGCGYWWDEPTGQWYSLQGCGDSPPPPTPPPNAPPTATFTSSCSALSCSFDAGASSDSDGSIGEYRWQFGDGTDANGKTAQHTYAGPGTYAVTLTVTDNGGASATESKRVTLIGLTARGYKVKGLQRVDLSWSGSNAASFDVYRDGARLATVAATNYTDNLSRNRPGTYRYWVCEAGTSTCSNRATVAF
jgi:PKD repeat protein